MIRLAMILIVTLAAGVSASEVTVEQGRLKGSEAGGVMAFKGIRYAAPVDGANRWRPPQPAPRFDGVRAATTFGPACPQPARRDRDSGVRTMDEDCLTLNVWAPAGAEGLPVMVWIHGGAFRLGSGSQRVYDGSTFARQGVVLVTLDYRLGRFGFFAHPALSEGGNFALMDQAAALGWVQRNIASFGGDPGNVTIFGESAGGASVVHLLASPRTTGLFHRAIIQSGGGHQLDGHLSEKRLGKKSLLQQGIDFAGKDATAAELRGLTADAVLGERVVGGGVGSVGPIIDGDWVPMDPGVAFQQGAFQHVPILIGANSQEASVLQAFGITPEQAVGAANVDVERYAALYPDGDAAAAWGDGAFVAGARHVARSAAGHDVPAYLYHFDYVLEARRGRVPGANHGSDVVFVFDALDGVPLIGRFVTAGDRRFAESVQSYWVNFARTGNPNGDGLPPWPRYRQDRDELLYLGPTIETRTRFRQPQLDFHQARWERMEQFLSGR